MSQSLARCCMLLISSSEGNVRRDDRQFQGLHLVRSTLTVRDAIRLALADRFLYKQSRTLLTYRIDKSGRECRPYDPTSQNIQFPLENSRTLVTNRSNEQRASRPVSYTDPSWKTHSQPIPPSPSPQPQPSTLRNHITCPSPIIQ